MTIATVRSAFAVFATLTTFAQSGAPAGTDAFKGRLYASQSQDRMDPRIPAPIATEYKDIRDAKDWLNPKVIIRAEGVEVVSRGLPTGRKTVSQAELRALIINLPVADWPIRQNHDAAEKILKALGITVDWWP